MIGVCAACAAAILRQDARWDHSGENVQGSSLARRRRPWGRLALLLVYLLLLGLVWMAWRDPAWRVLLSPVMLAEFGREVLAWPMGSVWVLLAYVVAVALAMPVLALITLGVLIFGPWPGMAYALVGMVAGATVTYGLGRVTGAQALDRLLKGRLQLMSTHLHRRGLWAIVLLRALPVAPFIVVNLGAGALRVRLRDYVLGTFLGLLPGTVLISLFMRQVQEAVRTATLGAWMALAGGVLLVACALWWLNQQLRARKLREAQ